MGMDPATIAWLAGTVGGKAIESFGQQDPYQKRNSFRGSNADPVTMLSEVHSALSGLLPGAAARANAPVTLPDATVGDLPSFAGGNLPGPIGVTSLDDSGHSGLKSPLTLPGMGLDLSGLTNPYNNRIVPPSRGTNPDVGEPGEGDNGGGTGHDDPHAPFPGSSKDAQPGAMFLPESTPDAAPTRRTPTMLPGVSGTDSGGFGAMASPAGAGAEPEAGVGPGGGMGLSPMPGMPDMSHLDARTQGALQLLLHAAGGAV